jgi:hypothetical protein
LSASPMGIHTWRGRLSNLDTEQTENRELATDHWLFLILFMLGRL